mmetsp:Transcript_28391/g.79855  ORF Transcript_28391/g.79855 Transcript_28391/m.79855 type:complete len:167 (-) Transcript_28391:538-1038(-)
MTFLAVQNRQVLPPQRPKLLVVGIGIGIDAGVNNGAASFTAQACDKKPSRQQHSIFAAKTTIYKAIVEQICKINSSWKLNFLSPLILLWRLLSRHLIQSLTQYSSFLSRHFFSAMAGQWSQMLIMLKSFGFNQKNKARPKQHHRKFGLARSLELLKYNTHVAFARE